MSATKRLGVAMNSKSQAMTCSGSTRSSKIPICTGATFSAWTMEWYEACFVFTEVDLDAFPPVVRSLTVESGGHGDTT